MRHLLPKQVKSHGLKEANVSFTDEAPAEVVRRYTREAGVRNMEREISTHLPEGRPQRGPRGEGAHGVEITPENLNDYLGVPRYRSTRQEERNEIGLATGLAWTEVGGEILPIEVTLMPGKGALRLTGKLGDVMQESAHAAMSLRPLAGRGVRHRPRLQPPARRPHPRARGRDPQGRPFGRHHDVHRARLRPDPDAGSAGRRHDRRDHPRGQGPAHRRREGEAAGRPPHRRHARSSCRARTRRTWRTCRKNVLEDVTVELVEHIDEVLKIASASHRRRFAGRGLGRRTGRGHWAAVPDGVTH